MTFPSWIMVGGHVFPESKKVLKEMQLSSELNLEYINITSNYCYFLFYNLSSNEPCKEWGRLFEEKEQSWYSHDNFINSYKNVGSKIYNIFVFPRPGTISPWSSKATNIANITISKHISRIERGEIYTISLKNEIDVSKYLSIISKYIHDPLLTEYSDSPQHALRSLSQIESKVSQVQYCNNLEESNKKLGLGISENDMKYLLSVNLSRAWTDVELFMFAQINSEHCRHKVFSSKWKRTIKVKQNDIDNLEPSLFDHIKSTFALNPGPVLSAYSDNAAIMTGPILSLQYRNHITHKYHFDDSILEPYLRVIKVETHNHPTAVCPFPGAATGSGGEIRDEGSVGKGSHPKAALVGYSVSDLHLPVNDSNQISASWEETMTSFPNNFATPLEITIQAPLGASSYNNEYGRPLVAGYFRTLTVADPINQKLFYGYHKPIMIAGGVGSVRSCFANKPNTLTTDHKYLIAVLGGPGYRIGLGGGSASSQHLGSLSSKLDFASVQRDNAEMERRCQEVIDACCALQNNPIISIHDVGAGGLSNAVPELVNDVNAGCYIRLRDILTGDPTLSPLEIWCNESQERYVMIVHSDNESILKKISLREQCPLTFIGDIVTKDANERRIQVWDSLYQEYVVDLPFSILFSLEKRRLIRDLGNSAIVSSVPKSLFSINQDSLLSLLSLPCIASKSFLITICDRSVTGLVSRDPMVGPWQVPVSDAGVTRSVYPYNSKEYHGESIAIGEKPLIALSNPVASANMAIGEALLNLLSADIESLGSDVTFSANWMATSGLDDPDLHSAVESICKNILPQLGLCIPVGKDSLSMKIAWKNENDDSTWTVKAPLSLVVTAFGLVSDVRFTITPQLKRQDSVLFHIDLASGKRRMGGSCFFQITKQLFNGMPCPDMDNPRLLSSLFQLLRKSRHIDHNSDVILAYHDISDGGLFATIVEMCIAGHMGMNVHSLNVPYDNPIEWLLSEELGAVIQVNSKFKDIISEIMKLASVPLYEIATLGDGDKISFSWKNDQVIFSESWQDCWKIWANPSYIIQSLRGNPLSSKIEYENYTSNKKLYHSIEGDVTSFSQLNECIFMSNKPKIAILREQGVNGHVELAYAFSLAGFEAIDITMSDLINGSTNILDEFNGLAAPGGFSYGDCLGAGRGWAQSILNHTSTRNLFERFFHRKDTFTLGICNGCQMLSHLTELIPNTRDWPKWQKNESTVFESRMVQVSIPKSSRSIFFADSFFVKKVSLVVPIAHGEGRAVPPVSYNTHEYAKNLENDGQIALLYCDKEQSKYPNNPSGTFDGIAGVTTTDGRCTLIMPHPERVVLTSSETWRSMTPKDKEFSPWLQMFINARKWLFKNYNI